MPFETVALDFITKLPVSQGYDSILTVTDHEWSKTYPWPITLGQMDSQNVPINGSNNIFGSGSMSVKITGTLIFHWQNSCTTIGPMKPQGSPPSSCCMGSTLVLIGSISLHLFPKCP